MKISSGNKKKSVRKKLSDTMSKNGERFSEGRLQGEMVQLLKDSFEEQKRQTSELKTLNEKLTQHDQRSIDNYKIINDNICESKKKLNDMQLYVIGALLTLIAALLGIKAFFPSALP